MPKIKRTNKRKYRKKSLKRKNSKRSLKRKNSKRSLKRKNSKRTIKKKTNKRIKRKNSKRTFKQNGGAQVGDNCWICQSDFSIGDLVYSCGHVYANSSSQKKDLYMIEIVNPGSFDRNGEEIGTGEIRLENLDQFQARKGADYTGQNGLPIVGDKVTISGKPAVIKGISGKGCGKLLHEECIIGSEEAPGLFNIDAWAPQTATANVAQVYASRAREPVKCGVCTNVLMWQNPQNTSTNDTTINVTGFIYIRDGDPPEMVGVNEDSNWQMLYSD